MNVTIVSRQGDKLKRTELALEKGATVKDLKKAFSTASKKDINRISFKVGDGEKTLRLDDDSKALTEYGAVDKAVIQFKDLGAQIGSRTAFLVENFGPIVFLLLFFLRSSFIYRANSTKAFINLIASNEHEFSPSYTEGQHLGEDAIYSKERIYTFMYLDRGQDPVMRDVEERAMGLLSAHIEPLQQFTLHLDADTLISKETEHEAESGVDQRNWVAHWAVICWVAHFLKRELETLFVHKFSRPTMPLSNLFKNCIHDWLFVVFISYHLCSLDYVPPSVDWQVYLGMGIFVLSELGNLKCHLMLSKMRPKEGSQDRSIPRGFLFDYVACPYYTFEVLSWVGFSLMTGLLSSWIFTLVGFLRMTALAVRKHKSYKKTYDKEYTQLRRKAIAPFLI
eukprot:gene25695-31030_t